MLIDTHCHMNMMFRTYKTKTHYQPLSSEEIEICQSIIKNAQQKFVTHIINVGTDLIESKTCIDLAQQFKSCFATIGLHPNDATKEWENTLLEFNKLLQNKHELKIVGIGECGIDKHYPGYDLPQQKRVFAAQIELALQHNLAVVVHSRDADAETFNALYEFKDEPNFKGVIHCFSSDLAYAQKYIDLGFVLGIGGTVTYPKNHVLREVVTTVPLEKIILETDTPFLPPQVIRGKQNNPSHIKTIAEYIAEIRNESFEHIAQVTTTTSHQLFGIKD